MYDSFICWSIILNVYYVPDVLNWIFFLTSESSQSNTGDITLIQIFLFIHKLLSNLYGADTLQGARNSIMMKVASLSSRHLVQWEMLFSQVIIASLMKTQMCLLYSGSIRMAQAQLVLEMRRKLGKIFFFLRKWFPSWVFREHLYEGRGQDCGLVMIFEAEEIEWMKSKRSVGRTNSSWIHHETHLPCFVICFLVGFFFLFFFLNQCETLFQKSS